MPFTTPTRLADGLPDVLRGTSAAAAKIASISRLRLNHSFPPPPVES